MDLRDISWVSLRRILHDSMYDLQLLNNIYCVTFSCALLWQWGRRLAGRLLVGVSQDITFLCKDLPLRQRKWRIGLSAGTWCTRNRTEMCAMEATRHRVAQWRFAKVSQNSTASIFSVKECPSLNTSSFITEVNLSVCFVCKISVSFFQTEPETTNVTVRHVNMWTGDSWQLTVDPSLFDGSNLCGLYLKIQLLCRPVRWQTLCVCQEVPAQLRRLQHRPVPDLPYTVLAASNSHWLRLNTVCSLCCSKFFYFYDSPSYFNSPTLG
jgi:hypothetical protein